MKGQVAAGTGWCIERSAKVNCGTRADLGRAATPVRGRVEKRHGIGVGTGCAVPTTRARLGDIKVLNRSERRGGGKEDTGQ